MKEVVLFLLIMGLLCFYFFFEKRHDLEAKDAFILSDKYKGKLNRYLEDKLNEIYKYICIQIRKQCKEGKTLLIILSSELPIDYVDFMKVKDWLERRLQNKGYKVRHHYLKRLNKCDDVEIRIDWGKVDDQDY